MEHQNWDIIYIQGNKVLKDKEEKEKEKEKKTQIKVVSNERKLEKKIEEGILKHKKTSVELGKQIEKERLKLNMTRKDLAYRINLPVKNINDIENGKAKYNPQHINKIKRILKMNS